MPEDNKKGSRKSGVNDFYVKGEERQGIRFYLAVALMTAFAIVIAFIAYSQAPPLVEIFWSGIFFILSISIGAVVGIFGYSAFSRFKFIQIMARNSLKTSPQSYPRVFDQVKLAAGRLSMDPVDTFVTQNPMVNAFMVRLGLIRRRKAIVLNTGLLQTMEDDELLFIIGHELSHVKFGRWRRSGRLGLPYLLTPQYVEYRCDRGGLVASNNIEASARALLKLATGKEYVDMVDMDSFDREEKSETSKMLLKLSTHPMIDDRIRELLRFYHSPGYK